MRGEREGTSKRDTTVSGLQWEGEKGEKGLSSKRDTTVSGLQWEGGRGDKGLSSNRHTTVSSGLQWEGGREKGLVRDTPLSHQGYNGREGGGGERRA